MVGGMVDGSNNVMSHSLHSLQSQQCRTKRYLVYPPRMAMVRFGGESRVRRPEAGLGWKPITCMTIPTTYIT